MKKILIDLRKAEKNSGCDYAILIKQLALLNKDEFAFTVMGDEKTLLTLKGFENVKFLAGEDKPYESQETAPHYDGVFSLDSRKDIINSSFIASDSFFFHKLKRRNCLLIEIPEGKEASKEYLSSISEKISPCCKNLFEKEEAVGKLLIAGSPKEEDAIDYSEFMTDESDFLLYRKGEWDLFSIGLKEGATYLYDYLFNRGNMNFRNAMGKLMFRNSYSFFKDNEEIDLLEKTSYLYNGGVIQAFIEGNPSEMEFKNVVKTLLLLTK